MSRAFVPVNKIEHKIRGIIGGECSEEQIGKLFKFKNDPLLQFGTRLVRYHSRPYAEFKNLLTMALRGMDYHFREEYLQNCPLIVVTKANDTLRVFPNLPIDNISTEIHNTCSSLLHWSVIETLYKTYKDDCADERKAKAWETPARIWKRLKKCEDMTTPKVLTRYTNLQKVGGFSDAQMRDLATAIDEIRKPMELIFCEKPEDYIQMYTGGPSSCMSVKPENAPNHKFLWDVGLHPCSYYHYHPYTRGVYVKFQGKVAARTILYEKRPGEWCYGRIFSTNDKIHERFQQSLHVAGHHPLHPGQLPDKSRWEGRVATFEVPGVKRGIEWYMPLPYMDNLSSFLNVTWDNTAKVFRCIQGKRDLKSNVVTTSQTGRIAATELTASICSHCANPVPQGRGYRSVDGLIFCGKRCMRGHNYVQAYRGDGTIAVIRHTDEMVLDAFNDEMYYTNEQAAIDMYAVPVIDDILVEPEENLAHVSRFGTLVEAYGKLYMANPDHVATWLDKGFVCENHNKKKLSHRYHGGACYMLNNAPSKVNVQYTMLAKVEEFDTLIRVAA